MIRRFFILFTLIFSFLLIAAPAFAQIESRTLKESNCLAVKADGSLEKGQVATLDCVPIIIGNVVFWLLVFAGIVALFLIIISGFKFVTSGGEPKKAEGARKTLTYAIIGLVLILLSFAIVRFIADVTGVGCITRFGLTQCVPKICNSEFPTGWCPTGQHCATRSGHTRCIND